MVWLQLTSLDLIDHWLCELAESPLSPYYGTLYILQGRAFISMAPLSSVLVVCGCQKWALCIPLVWMQYEPDHCPATCCIHEEIVESRAATHSYTAAIYLIGAGFLKAHSLAVESCDCFQHAVSVFYNKVTIFFFNSQKKWLISLRGGYCQPV